MRWIDIFDNSRNPIIERAVYRTGAEHAYFVKYKYKDGMPNVRKEEIKEVGIFISEQDGSIGLLNKSFQYVSIRDIEYMYWLDESDE